MEEKIMNYIVLDLEWNQSMRSDTESTLLFEIIEIGAVKLNENFEKKGTYQKLIKPEVFKKIHPIISNITSLHDRDFEYEKGFKYVIKEFLRWCGEDYILCTYGSQDLYELQCNMKYHNIEMPWSYPLKYIDVQKIFSVQQEEETEQMSLERTVKYLDIKQKNVYHRALGDAIYTAEVLAKLDSADILKYMSLDHYNLPLSNKEAKECELGTHNEYLTKEFDSKDSLLKYPDLYITKCPICRKKCRKKLRWFSDGSKYLCVAKCEEHGLIEGIINIKKVYDKDRYYGIRKVSTIDENKYQYIAKRKETICEKRRMKRKGTV